MYYYLSVLLSNLTSFSENNYKYFIGYLYNDDNIKPLHIMLPKTSVSVNSYDRVQYFYNKETQKVNFKRLKKKQVFLKECKETEEKEVTHINVNLNDFSYSPGESDEEYIFF